MNAVPGCSQVWPITPSFWKRLVFPRLQTTFCSEEEHPTIYIQIDPINSLPEFTDFILSGDNFSWHTKRLVTFLAHPLLRRRVKYGPRTRAEARLARNVRRSSRAPCNAWRSPRIAPCPGVLPPKAPVWLESRVSARCGHCWDGFSSCFSLMRCFLLERTICWHYFAAEVSVNMGRNQTYGKN